MTQHRHKGELNRLITLIGARDTASVEGQSAPAGGIPVEEQQQQQQQHTPPERKGLDKGSGPGSPPERKPSAKGKPIKSGKRRRALELMVAAGSGMSHEAIARQMGIQEDSVASTITRARRAQDRELLDAYEAARAQVVPELLALQHEATEAARAKVREGTVAPRDLAALIRESTSAITASGIAQEELAVETQDVAKIIATSEEARARALARAMEIVREKEKTVQGVRLN